MWKFEERLATKAEPMLDEFKHFGLRVNEAAYEDLECDEEDELPDRVASIKLFHFLRDQDFVLLR